MKSNSAYRRGVKVSITVAPKVSKMIDEFLATGLFGLTRAEVVQRLFYRTLQDPTMAAFSPTIQRQLRSLKYRVHKYAASSPADVGLVRRGRRG